MLEFYLFMRFDPGRRVGHNPLAALTYFIIYLLILVEILTGLVLYSQRAGQSGPAPIHRLAAAAHRSCVSAPDSLLPDVRVLRVRHFPRLCFGSGFARGRKRAAGQHLLRMEVRARRRTAARDRGDPGSPALCQAPRIAAARHAGGGARRSSCPSRRPGPGPVALFRNWISYAGTGHRRRGRTRVRRTDGLSHHRRRRASSALRRPGDLLRSAGIRDRWHRGRVGRHVRPVDPLADAQAAVVRALSQVGPQPRQ